MMVKKLVLVAIVAFAVTACGKKELSVSYAPAPLQPALKANEIVVDGRSLTAFCWNGLQFITSWQASTPITQVLDSTGKPMMC